jgi:predicted ATP-dependent serine protease
MKKEIENMLIKNVPISKEPTLKTGNAKFDKWFSKDDGMVLRSSIYLSGTSGAGKTTLAVNIMNYLKDTPTCLYEREMTSTAVKQQTSNLKISHNNAYILDKKSCNHFSVFLQKLNEIKPTVIFVDSLQAIAIDDFPEMTEDAACAYIVSALREWIEDNNAILFIFGHNNKEGEFAGKYRNMQFCDAHIEMIYDEQTDTRIMRWGKKNRKGPMGTLYYIFGELGIEFFTPSEWEARKTDRNFPEYIATMIQSYASTLKSKEAKKDYNTGIKRFRKLTDSSEFIKNLLSLMLELSEKYDI